MTETRALLAIWHDVDADVRGEFLRWHTYEHLPERLALPGFVRARRYEQEDGPGQQFMSVLDVNDIGNFQSTDYLDRLNAPTEWTRRLMPRYGNVHRVLCRAILNVGDGIAPVACCLRFNRREGAVTTELPQALVDAIARLRAKMEIVRAQIGVVDEALSAQETEERRLRRKESTGGLDYVLVMTAIEPGALRRAVVDIVATLAAFASDLAVTYYRFSYAAGRESPPEAVA